MLHIECRKYFILQYYLNMINNIEAFGDGPHIKLYPCNSNGDICWIRKKKCVNFISINFNKLVCTI